MYIISSLNGVIIPHSKRHLPPTVSMEVSNSPHRYSNCEAHSALWFDMSHLVVDFAEGWHELNLELYMRPVLSSNQDSLSLALQILNRFATEYDLHQKASFGVRNARVLTML